MNIKLAAPAVIAGVAAAAGTVQKIATRRKLKKLVAKVNEDLENIDAFFAAKQQNPFDRAQTTISDRMLAGYYDDKTDAEVFADFDVLYATYQNN